MGIPWCILVLPILLQSALCELVRGPSELIFNLTYDSNKSQWSMFLSENNRIVPNDELLLFYINDVKSQPECSPATSDTFKNEMVKKSDTSYEFHAKQFFDYETQPKQYPIKCTVDNTLVVVVINIVNYDDEEPTLTSPMCSMKENVDYTTEITECKCTLHDPDGWLSKTTFTIINSNPNAVEKLEKEDELFLFDFDRSISDTEYTTTVSITTLPNQQLDYETKIFYSFSVQAKDSAGHSTTPKENVTCIIDVIDQNDMPPVWTDYFTTEQIVEKTNYKFNVTAVDGDKGINAEIKYHLISYDANVCGEEPCVSLSTENKQCIITVNPIDRDTLDLTTYKFELMAQEQDEPPYTANLTITFFIEDVDDNSPLCMSLTTSNSTNITYNNDDIKIAEFTFYENFARTIDGDITIKDVDTGVNAQFNVVLEEDESKTSEVQFTDAFLIVPTAGYREGQFQITVKNSKYLDYEDPPWQKFQFYVHSSGVLDPKKTDDLLVKINLLDYNDEIPIFEHSSYSTEVNETIEKGEIIIQVKATDRDAEDRYLTHRLVGAETITKLIDINVTEGIITVAVPNAFDYDRINPIFFQVEAVDAANPPHTTVVPVTVTLLDINNKAPTYISADIIAVEENQVIGIKLNSSITASDVDTTRNLTAKIDWDKSYATKNSQRLNSSNPVYKQAMQFLDLSFEKTAEDTITIELLVNNNNDEETAPDYETFDTLYLDILITDLNTKLPEFADKMSIDAIITINIMDINDNAPIFTNDTLNKKRTVYERSDAGIIVGSIEATDADIGDIVTYSCQYVDKDYDWFNCSKEGVLEVKETGQIDCDSHKTYYVNISCNATDGFWITNQEFSIYLLDRNDKIPQIEVNDSIPSAPLVKVYEKSEPKTLVSHVLYTDADRDVPFHTAICSFQEVAEECYKQFEVNTSTNSIEVKLGGKELDRDTGTREYNCTISCSDNPGNPGGEGINTNKTKFTIELLDINDNCPILHTHELLVSENVKEGTLIGNVVAEDIDEGDNAEIVISILTVTKDNKNNYAEKIFKMVKNPDYKINETFKQWQLMAIKDLRDFYGDYVLQLELHDLGNPQQSTEQDENKKIKETSKINLTVTRYNYYPPKFVFPAEDNKKFVLLSDQTPGKPLVMYLHNDIFPNIKITTGQNDECLEKWDPTFDVILTGKSSSLPNIFSIKKISKCVAELQVNELYKTQTASYQLQITTQLSKDKPSSKGEESYSESINLNIDFAPIDENPVFNTSMGPWIISIPEARPFEFKELEPSRKAYYPMVDLENLTVYYSLKTNNQNVSETFDVGITTGNLTLNHELNYLDVNYYEFEILAAKDHGSTLNISSDSLLSVKLSVEDINNHVPEWTQETFFGAIMKSTQKGSTILTLKANDLDVIDQDKLTYSINGTIKRNGSESISNIADPFKLDKVTGVVQLNFPVEYNMYGHFIFLADVQDVQDRFGNGPFSNQTTVTIYIVTEDNTLTFKFENALDDLVAKKIQVTNIISETLGWDCHDYSIDRDSQNGVTLNNVTACSIYCVFDDKLLTADEIKVKLNNINTYKTLRQSLLQVGVLLQTFDAEAAIIENLEGTLKAALIGVTVVLGTVCIILAVTFFLKARELSRRLKQLTEPKFGSDESNLNRKGINAPTTNVFAVEGSNPVFNNDINKDDFDNYDKARYKRQNVNWADDAEDAFPKNNYNQSVHSGDSELIGVEDSPDFDDIFKNNTETQKF